MTLPHNGPPSVDASSSSALAARFLCSSADPARVQWLQRALGSMGAVDPAPVDPAALVTRIAESAPTAVFVDFAALASGQDASGAL